MYKVCLGISAAAMLIATAPFAAAQSATARSSNTAQSAQPSGTLHDHIERAEDIVNRLLDKRQAGSEGNIAPNTAIGVKRSDIAQLHGELEMIRNAQQQTPSASAQTPGTLADHVARAKRISAGFMSSTQQPQASSGAAHGNDEIVMVDRTRVKELQDEIESIEHLAQQQHSNRESK